MAMSKITPLAFGKPTPWLTLDARYPAAQIKTACPRLYPLCESAAFGAILALAAQCYETQFNAIGRLALPGTQDINRPACLPLCFPRRSHLRGNSIYHNRLSWLAGFFIVALFTLMGALSSPMFCGVMHPPNHLTFFPLARVLAPSLESDTRLV